MQIYGDVKSGNCYKLKLLCALLSIEHDWVAIDILQGETRSDHFLSLNPNGQIPVCVADDGAVLTQSNAILFYLAEGSRYWPDERLAQTRVLEWQFFEQYSHEPSIAVARFIKLYQGMPENRRDEHQDRLKAGYRALDVMQARLQNRDFCRRVCRIAISSPPTTAASPIFHFMPTPMWRTRVVSICPLTRQSGPGSHASRGCRGMSVWTIDASPHIYLY